MKSLEIIGEAAKNVSVEIRALSPRTPWRLMAGMRDNLVHGYFGIDYELVWSVAVEQVPVLAAELTRLIAEGEATGA